MRTTAAAFLALISCSNAIGAVSYGTVEWRWRERSLGVLPVVGGRQTTSLSSGAVASTPNGTANPLDTTDARYHLILEARVIPVAGVTDLRGLGAFGANAFSSDTRSQGSFAAFLGTFNNEMWNAASSNTAVATTAQPNGPGLTLPAGATLLPDGHAGDRGIFGPFRGYMDTNPRAGGIQNFSDIGQGNPALINRASMEQVTVITASPPFTDVEAETNLPGPYFGRYDFMALNSWMPVAAFTYNLLDVATVRDVVVSFQVVASGAPSDSNIRGYRGIPNPGGNDLWQIDNAGVPDFVITVPAPGTAAVLGLGGLVAIRRRRAV